MSASSRVRTGKARTRFSANPSWVILGALIVFTAGPLLVLAFNSVKSNFELGSNSLGPPAEIHLENFINAWERGEFASTMLNSLILVGGTVASVLVLGGLAAYSLARLNPRGGTGFTVYMLGLSAVPVWIYIVPLFSLLKNIGLLNNLLGLILVYTAINSPFAIFLLRSYLAKFPGELEDSARVDGAGELQVLRRIVMPVMWPGFLTVGLVVGLAVWSEFQLALIFVTDESLMPVTTSYLNFNRRFGTDWALTSAAAVLMIAPVLALFFLLQRRFVEGLTQGALK